MTAPYRQSGSIQNDGMTTFTWMRGRNLLWDDTIVDTFSRSHVNGSAISVQRKAKVEKASNYDDWIGHYLLQPVVLETSGPSTFLSEFGTKLIEVAGEVQETPKTIPCHGEGKKWPALFPASPGFIWWPFDHNIYLYHLIFDKRLTIVLDCWLLYKTLLFNFIFYRFLLFREMHSIVMMVQEAYLTLLSIFPFLLFEIFDVSWDLMERIQKFLMLFFSMFIPGK